MQIWNRLSNGMGGLDWSGLSLMVEVFGVDDVEQLVHDLGVIKAHDPTKETE